MSATQEEAAMPTAPMSLARRSKSRIVRRPSAAAPRSTLPAMQRPQRAEAQGI
ncbi:hypothetical protein L226DRAFT_539772 [Lentinus tigrinus ALCF2SS1-7]|uniref:uncharacterized protein n=1 Tax=Lentinus tigrinus ALCF2SS1-7 TaxID=1328758 RepID=UPI00116615BC|nr:hypothetical protein L226DRAFT_539772 [Lentinus tigrinus ALCF2SS1-7]